MSKKDKKRKRDEDGFPGTIYVIREDVGTEDEYYTVAENPDEYSMSGEIIATYKLVTIEKLKITSELIPLSKDKP